MGRIGLYVYPLPSWLMIWEGWDGDGWVLVWDRLTEFWGVTVRHHWKLKQEAGKNKAAGTTPAPTPSPAA